MKKRIFAGLVFLGIVSAVIGVISPIHEVWHWLTALLSGVDATMGWDVTYIDHSKVSLFIGFSGMVGEILILTFLVLWLPYKKFYKLTAWIFGYSLSYVAIVWFVAVDIFIPLDLEVMLENYSSGIVYTIWYVFVLYYSLATIVQITTIRSYKKQMFIKKTSRYAKRVAANLEHIRNGGRIGEKLYKPLTLVK